MFVKKILKIVYYCVNIVFICVSISLCIFYYYGRDLPSELTLLDYLPLSSTRIYSSEGDVLEEYALEHRLVVPLEEIPVIVREAFIIAEDKDFYKHGGISIQGLIRAFINNNIKHIWSKKTVGGSTITQQVAKNLLVGNARNISRKIKEAIMAFRIESSISKDKILEIYLNQLYLGKGCYGVAAACEYYFGKNINNIKPEEAAFLASLPSSPTAYVNGLNSKTLLAKRNLILKQLYELGYIDKKQFKKSINKQININKSKKKHTVSYFSDEILRQVSQKVSQSAFFKCGYSITTTLNMYIQYCATKALEDGLIEFRETKPYVKIDYGTKDLNKINKMLPSTINTIIPCKVISFTDDYLKVIDKDNNIITIDTEELSYQDAELNKDDIILCIKKNNTYDLYQQPEFTGGIVVMDAYSGDILALSGGYSFDLSAFNCITQGLRQPGSTIKPFVYAAAIDNGMDAYEYIIDKPINIKLSDGSIYTPRNYDNKYLGKIKVKDALIFSKNAATINLVQIIGMHNIRKLLKSLNLTNKHIPISAVLGSIETSPINLISAFSIFLNKGIMVYPRFIKEIKQYNNKYVNQSILQSLCITNSKQIISESTSNNINNILHEIIEYGPSKRLLPLEKKYGIRIIGKTGTTNDSKDLWFIGSFTKDDKAYIIGVFVGYMIPKSLGTYASKVALPIFENFVNNFFTLRSNESWIFY